MSGRVFHYSFVTDRWCRRLTRTARAAMRGSQGWITPHAQRVTPSLGPATGDARREVGRVPLRSWLANKGYGWNRLTAARKALDAFAAALDPDPARVSETLPEDARVRTGDEDTPDEAALQAVEGAVQGGTTRTPVEWPERQPTSPQCLDTPAGGEPR